MKRTQKLIAAERALLELGISRRASSADELYQALSQHNMAWFPREGKWKKTERPVDGSGREMVSIFTRPDGTPTGVFRLRIMSHPDLLDRIAAQLEKLFTVLEPPTDPYPNRKGPGHRTYATYHLGETKAMRRLRTRAKAEAHQALQAGPDDDED